MRRSFSGALVVTVLALVGLFVAAPAHAATSSLDYTVSSTDPTTDSWPSYLSDCSEFFNWSNGSRNAAQHTASVEVTGEYQFQDLFSSGDGYIAVLAGPYDPADVSNCIVAIDDAGSVTLDQDTSYTLLLAGKDGTLGDFSYSVSGPGEFSSPGKAVSLTGVSAVPALVNVGDPVDLTATVTSTDPGVDLSGTAEFFADGASIGTATVTAAGLATLPPVTLSVGAHSIVAVYSGNVELRASTSLASIVTVAKIVTNTTLSATPNPIIDGETATLTATVTGAGPTGVVEFYADGSLLGSAPLSSGVASLPFSTWSVGSHSLTAAYLGDATHEASSTAAPLTFVVNAKAVIPPVPAPTKPVAQSLANSGADSPSLYPLFAATAALVTGVALMLTRRRATK